MTLVPRRIAWLVVPLALGVSSTANATGGDTWVTLGHDGTRTARSIGKGAITGTPQIAWKHVAGGSLAPSQLVTADLLGDGIDEGIFVAAGAVRAQKGTGTTLWTSPQFGATGVVGVYDLDGSGKQEVVALGAGPTAVTILDASNGNVLWTYATTDAAFDAVVVPQGSAYSLYVALQLDDLVGFSFASGLTTSSANQVFAVADPATPAWSLDLIAADVDGDGVLDVVRGSNDGFVVYDSATGAIKCDGSAMNETPSDSFYYGMSLGAADVDGDGRSEVIVYDYSYYYSEDAGIYVVSCTGSGAPLTPKIDWSETWDADITPGPGNDVDRFQIVAFADGVTTFGPSGPVQLAFALWTQGSGDAGADAGTGTWQTFVVDPISGAVISGPVGQVLEAVADIDDDGYGEIVTRDANGIGALPKPYFSTLHAYDLDTGSFVDKGWGSAQPNARVADLPGSRAFTTNGSSSVIAARQNTTGSSDPADELYVYSSSTTDLTDSRPGSLLTVHGSNGMTVNEFIYPTDITGQVELLSPDLVAASAPAQCFVMLTDGGLRILDETLVQKGDLLPGNFSVLPAVASLDGKRNDIYFVDSAGILRALDGTQLVGKPPAADPVTLWSYVNADQGGSRGYVDAPGLVLPATNGTSNLMVRGHSKAAYEQAAMVAVSATGAVVFQTDLDPGWTVNGFENFELLDDLDGDGVRDAFGTELDPNDVENMVLRSGATGAELAHVAVGDFYASTPDPANDFLQGHAAYDVNGDGKLDVVTALYPSWIAAIGMAGFPGTPFTSLYLAENDEQNGQMMVAQLDPTPPVGLVRANSQDAFGAYDKCTLATGAVTTTYMPPFPGTISTDANNAAFVQKPGSTTQFDVVWAGMDGSGLGEVILVDGASFMPVWSTYLAGGFASGTAPTTRAALYDPVAADIDGSGNDTILVGSDDGYLYALKAADGSLAFVVSLGAPVIHVIAADVDEDPQVEIVASLGDGTLVALDQPGAYGYTPVAADAGAPDSGAPADAAAPDSGSTSDAGAPGADGGLSADAGSAGTPGSTGGCGCKTAGANVPERTAWALVLPGLAWVVRRRRRALTG